MNDYKLDLEKYATLARQAAAEGCVLLENEKQALPLREGESVAVFGRMAFHYYKSGLGSGGLVNTRYVVGILDALNETYVIFITENDVLKAGLPIYHVDRTIRETGTFFNDQAHIVYVNSQIKDETALGKLMHDFFCTNSKDMNYSILAQRVRYFKEDTKGVAAMCRAMEKMRDETEHETSIKHALAMLADGMPYEKVAKYSELPIEEVRALAEKKSA